MIYSMGIVTDDTEDNEMVMESKYVSGLHVESVYSEDVFVVTDTNLTLMVQITGSFWKDWISFISDPV